MPTLPLALPSAIDGGQLPVRGTEDVLATFPYEVRTEEQAPIRDAIVAALTAIAREYQRRARQAVAQADPLRATGIYLDGLASDNSVYAQLNESNDSLRGRLLGVPALVTPDAIMGAVNELLAPYTATTARYFESGVDAWFVSDGTVDIESFVTDDSLLSVSPHYADRLYEDDAVENGGDFIANREVAGAWTFADVLGRHFILRIPPLEAVDNEGFYVLDADTVDDGWIADGSDTSGAESDGSVTVFTFTGQQVSDDLYAAIVSFVENAKGQGIRWSAVVDQTLLN